MEKQMKLFTNMTKPFVLFVLLFALGVGQMWGTARTFKSGEKIYFKDASGNITWGDLKCLWKVSNGDIFAYFWNDSESAWSSSASVKYGNVNEANSIYEITVPGSGKEFTKVLFTRHPNPTANPTFDNKWNQTEDQTPDVGYNLFCIANDGSYDSQRNPTHKWKGNWSRYAHNGAVVGSFNDWNPDTYPLSNSGVAGALIPLAASTTYEFKILLGETYYGINSASTITSTLTSWWTFYSGQGNVPITTDVTGDYGFAWNASSKNVTVYFPKALYQKSKYIYFDVTRETYWNANPFTARFYLKYFDSGSNLDGMPLTCSTPVEDYVYYAQVPDNGYIGQIQMNRYYNGEIHGIANVAYVYSRSSASQNCLQEESGKTDSENEWTPQWTTYCPPMSDVDLEEDGTTLSWGGDGSSGTPYLIPTGASIKVKATNATKAVDDDNMTIYYQFKKAGTEVQAGSTTASATITASGSTGTKEAVTVEAYNYYNSTSGTHLASSAIYYEARTPYTISYAKGTPSASISGSHGDETKLKGVNFTLPNSAVFTRTGFTQTGWATSDGGPKAYDLGSSYTTDAAQTFYPLWTENEYNITIAVSGSGTTSPASSTVGKIETPSGNITATPGTGYSFREWGFSKTGDDYDVWCAGGYTSTDATIKILAKHDGTLTANFTANNYVVGLDNREADPEHGGTANVSVTYDATTGLTSAITPPEKENYTFGGYYISTNHGATLTNIQLIDESGNWNKNVSGYIDENKKWVCAGDTMLYAKWIENLYSVTVVAGANGSVSPTSVNNIGYVTASGDITATANTGYHFVSWTLPANVPTAYSYIATSNPIRIRATASGQTITANFAATNYTVTLDNREPTTPGTASVSVTYDATTGLTTSIMPPQKTHYTFGGYFTEVGGAGTQLINADGSWIANVSGYTSATKQWIYADDLTLYAKWTETLYSVNVEVSPTGAGSVKVGGSTVNSVSGVGYSTHSSVMTADSVNALWTFKEWQATSDAHLQTVSYSIYRPTMEITAEAANQTVTAVFQHRYNLLGSQYAINTEKQNQELGGMPGWTYGSGADFTVNSYPGDGDNVTVELVCTRNLVAGTYIFEIHDRATGKSLGRKNGSSIYVLGEGESVELQDGDDQNQSIFFYPQAEGEYTFKITLMRKSGVNYYPTVTILRPQQVHIGWKYENIGGSLSDGNTGGTAEIKKKSDDSDVPNGTWLTYGTVVTYNANPVKGYKVDWYANNDYSTGYITSSYSFDHDGNSTGNGYVKFTELATKVSLENDGHGHIEIDGVTRTDTTCGVTTTRSLTAVPNTGYSFSNWSKPSGDDIDFNTSTNPTTLKANGNGLQTGQQVYANFTAKTYSVTLKDDHGDSHNGSATATYDATSLTSITHATFDGWNLLGYWNNVGAQVTDAFGNLQTNVANYTSLDNKWRYDGNVDLWAHWSRSVTLDREGGTTGATSMTVTYKGTTLGSYTAPTRTGYTFAGYWTAAGGTGTLVINTGGTLEADVSGYTDASHQWIKQDATTLYAKWTADTYTVTLHNDHGGESSDDGTATATYDDASLSSITHAKFTGWELLGYWNSSAVQVANADGSLIVGVTGFTDASAHWTKTDNADLWAHWSRTIKLDKNGGKTNGSVTVTYKDKATTPIAPGYSGYTLEGYYAEAGCTTKVMNTDGSLVANVSGYTDGSSNWTNKTIAVLYAKWTSPNFVIYRTGDKAGDPHALSDAVESFAGGTISKPIEFRMKVNRLDKWYTLCLPFEVSAVKVWDEEDGQYYDLVPYYRTGDKYYTGHYIIRTPVSTTDFDIENFDSRDRWVDPSSSDGYLPSANTPYIIQWHDSWFQDKYISFFSPTGESIPTSMNQGANTSSDETVNIYGNNCMTSGTVRDAYMLDPDYGSGGAWMREEVGTERTVLPFECFIRANATTTAKYRVLRRDMADTPTGWDTVSETENKTTKVLIDNNIYIIREGRIYTIQGTLVKEGK